MTKGLRASRLGKAVERLKHPKDAFVSAFGSEALRSVFVLALVSRGVNRIPARPPEIQRAPDKNIVNDSGGDHDDDNGPQ